MFIESIKQLGQEELGAVRDLIQTCQCHDKTFREPYLSNNLNFDQNMPAFFLAYVDGKLVGLLTVYADGDETTLSLMVSPEYRRQGMAKQLYQSFVAETDEYQLTDIAFQSESIFIQQHPGLLVAWNLAESAEGEWLLTRNRSPFELASVDVSVFLANSTHVDAISQFQSQAFDNELDISRRYAEEAISDPESRLYVAIKDGEPVASCTVDLSGQDNYIYGLATGNQYQRQGIGTFLMQSLINDLVEFNDKEFQIAVDEDNSVAIKLYEKLGFKKVSRVVYLENKDVNNHEEEVK